MSSYATPADLAQLGLAPQALVLITTSDQQAALDAASNLADGYLAGQFTLPIVMWSSELRMVICQIASYRLMRRRGFRSDGADDLLVQDFKEAVQWLKDVRDGKISPQGIQGSDGKIGDAAGGPMVATDPLRGWQSTPALVRTEQGDDGFTDWWN